jgi:hypothetical protein
VLERIRARALPNKTFLISADAGPADAAMDALQSRADRLISVLTKGLLAVGAAGATMGTLITRAGLGMNAELETSELQFRTLLGSADAAHKHVASLFQFAKETPFETAPVVTASRLMLTFGGTALATEKNLRLVGDAAAASGAGIDELGFWFGRIYAAMKGGQPFGEARMRLQELAVLSPEAAKRLDQLSQSGASMEEMWKVLTDDMGRFGGAMQLQAASATGLWSTLKDTFSLGAAAITTPVFDALKRMGVALVEFTSSPQWDALLERGRGVFGDIAGFMDRLTDAFRRGGPAGAAQQVARTVQDAFDRIDWIGMAERVWAGVARLLPVLSARAGALLLTLADGIKRADWSQISEAISEVIVISMTNLDYPRIFQAITTLVVTVAPKIIEGLVIGIIRAAAAHPLDFVLLLLALGFTPTRLLGAVARMLETVPIVGAIASWLLRAFASVADVIVAPIKELLATAGRSMLGGLLEGSVGFWDQAIAPWFARFPEFVASFFDNAPAWLTAAGAAILGGLLAGVTGAAEDLWRFFGEVGPRVIGFFAGAEVWLLDAGARVIDGFTQAIYTQAEDIWRFFGELGGRVVDAVGDLGGVLWDAGWELVQGFLRGIDSAASGIGPWIVDAVLGGIPALVKRFLGIGSPSKLFQEYGEQTVQGFVLGIRGRVRSVETAVEGLMKRARPTLTIPARPTLATPSSLAGRGADAGSVTYVIVQAGSVVGSREALLDAVQEGLGARGRRVTGVRPIAVPGR